MPQTQWDIGDHYHKSLITDEDSHNLGPPMRLRGPENNNFVQGHAISMEKILDSTIPSASLTYNNSTLYLPICLIYLYLLARSN